MFWGTFFTLEFTLGNGRALLETLEQEGERLVGFLLLQLLGEYRWWRSPRIALSCTHTCWCVDTDTILTQNNLYVFSKVSLGLIKL